MKRNIVFCLLLVLSGAVSYAQCDKKLVLTSSKTEYLNASFVTQRTVDEQTVIEISKPNITITPGGEDNKMTGTIKSDSCNWKVPFKEGKTVYKAILSDPGGEAKSVTITIEGKEGKQTLLAEVDEMPDQKIRVSLDKFEEKK